MQTTLEAGLRNVQAIILMASDSEWYRHILVEWLQDMATHGFIIHPDNPTYLTCRWHTVKGRIFLLPTAEAMEKHFTEDHRRLYAQWRYNNASEPPIVEMDEILPEERPEDVWNDTGGVFVDVPALQPDAMAMPCGSMTSSSSSSQMWKTLKRPTRRC